MWSPTATSNRTVDQFHHDLARPQRIGGGHRTVSVAAANVEVKSPPSILPMSDGYLAGFKPKPATDLDMARRNQRVFRASPIMRAGSQRISGETTMGISRVIVAAGIGALAIVLAGCTGNANVSASNNTTTTVASVPATVSSSAPTSASRSAPVVVTTSTTPSKKPPAAAAGIREKAGVSCTNQIDYAGDPRSNAEINSIGDQTGYCPPIKNEPGVKCTDQLPYAMDSRSNAEINSIGAQTGYCPFEQNH